MNSMKVYWVKDVVNGKLLAGPFGSLDAAYLERKVVVDLLYHNANPMGNQTIKVVSYQVPVTIEH